MENAKPDDRMAEHMPQPSIQVAAQRLRRSLTWCKHWRDAHPKRFRAGLVACVLIGLYASGWLLSLIRAVLWLIIALAIGTAGLLWASRRWTWVAAMLDGRRWLLTRRPYVALIAAGVIGVALWSLPTPNSVPALRESASSEESLADVSGVSTVEPADAATQPTAPEDVAATKLVESESVPPRKPSIAIPKTSKVTSEVRDRDNDRSHANATGLELLTLKGHNDSVQGVAFSQNGTLVASASYDGTVKVWDTTTGKESLTLKGHTEPVRSVAFSPDGKRLASASGETIKLWDATTGKESLTLTGHTIGVHCVAFSPDGKRLASASDDMTVKVWDATTGKELLTLKGHASNVVCAVFSPDGKRLASASWDNTVKVWDATTGKESATLRGHTDWVHCVAFSPDGKRLASASNDKLVKVWDATTGKESSTLRGHADLVLSVVFSPDGTRLASASDDTTVKVWNATTGQETLTLKGHTKSVQCVAYSPDGQRLASASADNTVKVWEVLRDSRVAASDPRSKPNVANSRVGDKGQKSDRGDREALVLPNDQDGDDLAVQVVLGETLPQYEQFGFKDVELGRSFEEIQRQKQLKSVHGDHPYVYVLFDADHIGREEFIFDRKQGLISYSKLYQGGSDEFLHKLIAVFGKTDKDVKTRQQQTPNSTIITTQIDYTFPKVLVRIIFATTQTGARTLETTCVVVIDRSWVTQLLNDNAHNKRKQIPWMLEVANSLPGIISDLNAAPMLDQATAHFSDRENAVLWIDEKRNKAFPSATFSVPACCAAARMLATKGERSKFVIMRFNRYSPNATPELLRQDVVSDRFGGKTNAMFRGNNALLLTPMHDLVMQMNSVIMQEFFPPNTMNITRVTSNIGEEHLEWNSAKWRVTCNGKDHVELLSLKDTDL